ncbi:MAG TPA: ATP-binding protein, partial [Chthoniobacterales bacterium]
MNSETSNAQGERGKTVVLLVDDQVLVAQVVRRLLEAEPSFVFHHEQDPQQALATVLRIRPAVILQDLDLPGANGLDLIRAYGSHPLTQGISVIVLSSRENPAMKQAAFEAGADDYLVKMPSRTELVARVRRHAWVCAQELQRAQEVRTLRENQAGLVEKNAELVRLNEGLDRLNRELARSNADLEQFAAMAAHDLQEPLRAVAGGVQLMERNGHGKLDQNGDELTRMIVEGSARMQALVASLLTYARAGQADKLEAVDTQAALERVLANLDSVLRESNAEVVFETLPELRFFAGQFDHLLQNLVSNALKYRGAVRPKVDVSAVHQLDAWVFRIADNGIGFDSQDADKIFGIFERLHGREQYAGTGIGLALVKKLVERRGGWIWADSVPGHGSTFYFSVPDEEAPWPIPSP